MTEAGAIYNALGRHTGAAGFRSPQQTLPNIPVSVHIACAGRQHQELVTLASNAKLVLQVVSAAQLSMLALLQPSVLLVHLAGETPSTPHACSARLEKKIGHDRMCMLCFALLPQVYEFRQYQLDPGYGSVPKLVAAFADG